ncbi:MAG: glycosyltransferase family 4 protein [Chitinophagales bacterium]
MKILLISSNNEWRGSEQVIDSIFNYNSVNLDFYLFCLQHSELYKKNAQKKNKVFVFKRNWIFLLSSAYRLKKICSKFSINLIHLNDSHSVNIYITACFLGLNIPAVLHRHVNIPVTNIWKYNFPKIKKIICVSNEVKSTASKTIPEEKLSVIYPGIPVDEYRRKEINKNFIKQLFTIPEEAKIIGIISAIAKEKNITEFIEIAGKSIKKNKNYHFVIIGDGSLYQNYKAAYSTTNIHFTGFRTDIAAVLSCFDIFLFTSKNEGLGVVLLEAMAAKVPVLSSNFPAVEELIEDKKTGFIYTDVNDALVQTELLINNEILRNNITTNAYRFVQQFDVTLMNKKIEAVYKSILTND